MCGRVTKQNKIGYDMDQNFKWDPLDEKLEALGEHPGQFGVQCFLFIYINIFIAALKTIEKWNVYIIQGCERYLHPVFFFTQNVL